MANKTERLRELLNERGVAWKDASNGYVSVTTFIANGVEWHAVAKHYLDEELDWMKLRSDDDVTPEQVVTALLGAGMEPNRKDRT